jgi:CheY-like chemotaxis protein
MKTVNYSSNEILSNTADLPYYSRISRAGLPEIQVKVLNNFSTFIKSLVVLISFGSGRKIRILLADDDAEDRELFEEVAAGVNSNIRLDTVPDGEKLMGWLMNKHSSLPDIIFMDLNMPRKGGKECLDEIRSIPKLRDIPIVIYSTSSSLWDIDDTFDKGANLYVRKPTSLRELTAIIKKVVDLDWQKHAPKSNKQQFVLAYR